MKKKKLGLLPQALRETPLNKYEWTIEGELHESILIINAYYKNNDMPNYRQFISKTEYITQDLQSTNPVWRTGRLAHYIDNYWWDRNRNGVYASDKHKVIITDYIGVKDNFVMNAINKYQNDLLFAETARKEKIITDPIDKLMEKEIKELPPDLDKWLEDDVFIKSRYIYYKYEPKVNLKGYCTHCKTDVTIYKPKHNQSGICPNCGSTIICKSIGKSTKVEDKKTITVLQKTSEGFVARYFDLYKYYGKNYRTAKITSREQYRDFYDNKLNVNPFKYSLFKNKYMRWNRGSASTSWYYNYNVYPHNIEEVTKDTMLKYSALDKLAGNRKDFTFNIDAFIKQYKNGHTITEHCTKVGLFNLARDLINTRDNKINYEERTLKRRLGIEHDDINILIEADVNLNGLNLFKAARKQGKRLTTEQLKEIISKYDIFKIENILKCVPVAKALRYLREQPEYISEKEIIYSDYLESCIKLKQDIKNTFVLFPKDLKMAHDVNVDLVNEMNNRKTYKDHNSKYSAIKKMKNVINELYYLEDNKFLIRAPEDAAEIVKEGQSLHHCVGGGYYSEKMAKGSIAILFLRDKENLDVSYYTLEVDRMTNEVRQIHGYKNMDSDKDRINKFINNFKRLKLGKLSLKQEAS